MNSSDYYAFYYTVVDNKTNEIGLVHYLENSEVVGLPASNRVEQPKAETGLNALFRKFWDGSKIPGMGW